jgi:LmbE family N-acetylglucosaminyl deacetylase
MKLRVFFTPSIVVCLMAAVALPFWCAVLLAVQPYSLIFLVPALFYSILLVLSGWALWRVRVLERSSTWDTAHRLLVLAPHEDDCVIAAGGIGVRNHRLGGIIRIVYLAPDEAPGMADRRAAEAHAAWRQAGLQESDLVHMDILPPLFRRDPQKLRTAATALRSIVDEFQPSAIIMPMFEGGHIHHDMVAALIGSILTTRDRFDIFEAPEYSPFTSWLYTPHRILALCARWLFGLVSYYGPPDGADERPVLVFRLSPEELDCKRRMLGSFVSQNAASLMETRSYPDRLVRWDPSRKRRRPFNPNGSYMGFVMALRRVLPAALVDRILPGQIGTIGRGHDVTDWTEEWELDGALSDQSSPLADQ